MMYILTPVFPSSCKCSVSGLLLSVYIIFIHAKYFSNSVSCFPSLMAPLFSVQEGTENDESGDDKREDIE